jgi:hypothetical protein
MKSKLRSVDYKEFLCKSDVLFLDFKMRDFINLDKLFEGYSLVIVLDWETIKYNVYWEVREEIIEKSIEICIEEYNLDPHCVAAVLDEEICFCFEKFIQPFQHLIIEEWGNKTYPSLTSYCTGSITPRARNFYILQGI